MSLQTTPSMTERGARPAIDRSGNERSETSPGTPLRRYLALLCAGLGLPIIAFVGYVLWQFSLVEQARLEREALDTARMAAASLDRDLAELGAELRALTTASSISQDDLEEFHRRSTRLSDQEGFHVVLRTPEGQHLVNTRRPFGEPLPNYPLADFDAEILASRDAVVSNVFPGRVANDDLFAVETVVRRDGEPRYLLGLSLDTDRVHRALLGCRAPGELDPLRGGSRRHDRRPKHPDTTSSREGPPRTISSSTPAGARASGTAHDHRRPGRGRRLRAVRDLGLAGGRGRAARGADRPPQEVPCSPSVPWARESPYFRPFWPITSGAASPGPCACWASPRTRWAAARPFRAPRRGCARPTWSGASSPMPRRPCASARRS